MKLLIVDDNENFSEMLKQTFSSEFSEIRPCKDGADALAEYEKFKPDWIFMDIMMRNGWADCGRTNIDKLSESENNNSDKL